MLTKNQWGLMEKLVTLREPFEQMTHDISSADASLADVVVTSLLVTPERHDNHAGVQTTKSVLLEDVKRRFQGMTDEPLYIITTSVDPRYRMRMFYTEQQTKATALLTAEVQQERRSTDVANPPAKRQPVSEEPAAATVKVCSLESGFLVLVRLWARFVDLTVCGSPFTTRDNSS